MVEEDCFDFVTRSVRLYHLAVERTYQQATASGPFVFILPDSLYAEGTVKAHQDKRTVQEEK